MGKVGICRFFHKNIACFPGAMAILWLLLMILNFWSSSGESDPSGSSLFVAVGIPSFLTFGHRSLWLLCRKGEGYEFIDEPSALMPERTAALGFSVLSVAILASWYYNGEPLPIEGDGAKWMTELLTTVPLLGVYTTSWKKLQVCKNQEETSVTMAWPGCHARTTDLASASTAEKK